MKVPATPQQREVLHKLIAEDRGVMPWDLNGALILLYGETWVGLSGKNASDLIIQIAALPQDQMALRLWAVSIVDKAEQWVKGHEA